MHAPQPAPAQAISLPSITPNAAGLDIGSAEIWACVPADRDAQPIRAFGTCTPDLYALADWLATCRVEEESGRQIKASASLENS